MEFNCIDKLAEKNTSFDSIFAQLSKVEIENILVEIQIYVEIETCFRKNNQSFLSENRD